MTELFEQLLSWVAQNPYWAGALIFTVAMTESLAVVGIVVPGVVIMFGIGALIAAGAIDFLAALSWAVAGAVVGDGVSFWFGRHYRERLRGLWPFSRHPKSLAHGIDFFERYGGKSVAVGRFFGPVRAVIPLVAGMMGMPPWRFLAANVLSALVWAPAYLLPGMVFGASLELASEVAFRLVILILLLAMAIWLTLWSIHRIFLLLQPYTTRMVQGILNWGNRHPFLSHISAALADPHHPEARGLSILATLLVIAFTLFTLATGWTLQENDDSGINHTVFEAMQSIRTPLADHFMVFISSLADPVTMVALVLSVGVLLWLGRRHTLAYWLAAAGFALVTGPLLTLALQSPRPDMTATQDALASTHTLWATVIYGFIAVMIAREMTPRLRWIAYSIAGLLIASVAFSRIYLGVNWLSDVVGSLALGLSWISALAIAYSRHTEPAGKSWPLLLTTSLSLVVALIIHSQLLHTQRFDAHRPSYRTETRPVDNWWHTGWSQLPAVRLDTRNRLDHRLTVQYAGSLQELRSELAKSGWRSPPELGWKNLLKLLSPSLSLQQLPVLPQVHDGEHEAFVLEKKLPGEHRLVLRLWDANITLTPDGLPLWLGLVAEQQKIEILGLITFASTATTSGPALTTLVRDIDGKLRARLTESPEILLIVSDGNQGADGRGTP